MNNLVAFMRSNIGRTVRIVLGILLIWLGLDLGAGTVVAIIGVIPILAGVFNFCLLAPLFGMTIWGKRRPIMHRK